MDRCPRLDSEGQIGPQSHPIAHSVRERERERLGAEGDGEREREKLQWRTNET